MLLHGDAVKIVLYAAGVVHVENSHVRLKNNYPRFTAKRKICKYNTYFVHIIHPSVI